MFDYPNKTHASKDTVFKAFLSTQSQFCVCQQTQKVNATILFLADTNKFENETRRVTKETCILLYNTDGISKLAQIAHSLLLLEAPSGSLIYNVNV